MQLCGMGNLLPATRVPEHHLHIYSPSSPLQLVASHPPYIPASPAPHRGTHTPADGFYPAWPRRKDFTRHLTSATMRRQPPLHRCVAIASPHRRGRLNQTHLNFFLSKLKGQNCLVEHLSGSSTLGYFLCNYQEACLSCPDLQLLQ